jgi:hypothetical protein
MCTILAAFLVLSDTPLARPGSRADRMVVTNSMGRVWSAYRLELGGCMMCFSHLPMRAAPCTGKIVDMGNGCVEGRYDGHV